MRKKYFSGIGMVMSAILTITMLGGNTIVMAESNMILY